MTTGNIITTVLFDFDGVIADTEGQYAIFFEALAVTYPASVPDLAASVRGVTLPEIIARFFSDYPGETRLEIAGRIRGFEEGMDFRFIDGAGEFLREVKGRGYKMGLVTSSSAGKMSAALERMELVDLFDAIVTSERVERGKPAPECYLLAAADLGVTPGECVVFEDSIAGITAGKRAGMKVAGVATTLPGEVIREHADVVLPGFADKNAALAVL
ncbi:MAG: HAD-IA family hydrolase [Odoribacteraceae bacterium]|jgi:beta-phosphoglucomutase-like phosphatase (HAD superfamily)|nr:HAD-IA family hydrolase [Odoribacteraceae bacterium]